MAGAVCAVGVWFAWTAAAGADAAHDKLSPSPCALAFSPDGATVAVCDQTRREVVLAGTDGKVAARIATAGGPVAVCWAAGTNRIYVAEFGAGTVAEIDPSARSIVRRLPVGPYPRDIAIAPKRKLLLTADFGLGSVSVISLESGKQLQRIAAVPLATAVAVSPDERAALVGGLIPSGPADAAAAAAIVPIDLQELSVGRPIALPPGSSSVRDIRIDPAGKWAYVCHLLGRTNVPTTQLDRGWVNTNALTIVDVPAAKRYATVLLDSPSQGAADPWSLAVSPDGKHLWVALAGIHEVATIDLARLHKALTAPRRRAKTPPEEDLGLLYRTGSIVRREAGGLGPRAVALSPDGRRLAVATYFSAVAVLSDTATHAETSRIRLRAPHMQRIPSAARRGERLFHDARKCFQNWLSCASCHPDGRADGLNWDLLNDGIGNPKNTRSMLLAHRTPPAMSTGVRDGAETAVRAGLRHIHFTQPTEADAAAIDAYLKSLTALPSPHLVHGKLSAAARRGEMIFRDEKTACTRCHTGELLTDGKLYNVGTRGRLDRRDAFDTPALVELWRSGPYLHDGSAATLKDILTTRNAKDTHGRTSHLTEAEITDLVEYLQSR